MEKGGKGFSLPSKSSLKSTTATNGKEDSSSPRPRGSRKVQFDNEDSPEQGFDFSSKLNGKSGASAEKGGKGSTSLKGKASKSKEGPPLELRIEQELPKNAMCIMNCEAEEILQGVQDQMILLSRDPTIILPVSFDRGLMFAQANGRYKNPQSVGRVLQTLKKYGVLEEEISLIGNVCPESAEEVFGLVPSLKSKRSTLTEPLEVALKELAELRKSDYTP